MTISSFQATVLMSVALCAAPMSKAWAETASDDAGADSAAPVKTSRTTAEEVVIQATRHPSEAGGLIKPQVETQSVSTVSAAFIRTQPAVQNAYQYVAMTPGALVSTADPYGLSTQGSINVHGLGQDELGYVLEGMPLNDIGYYTAYPSQFVDSENIDEVSLAQGSAELDSPVINAAGGLMSLTILDPSVHPGGSADVSYGSYDTYRGFLRLDSGLIGDTGLRGFGSYSYTSSDNWHGPGVTIRQHADFKLVKEWDDNRVTLSATLHNGVTPDYILPTLGAFRANGVNNNYDANFAPGDANYYKLYVGTFRIAYLTAPSRFRLNSDLVFNITPYWEYGYGNSPYGTTLTPDGNYQGAAGPYSVNLPFYGQNGGTVMANYTDLQHRAGVNAKLTYSRGFNDLIGGVWVDYSDEEDVQSYSGLNATGDPANLWADNGHGLITLPGGEPLLAGKDHVITQTTELFVADVMRLLGDRMTVELGFKEAYVSRQGANQVPGPQYKLTIDNAEPLPRAAVRYQLDDRNQVFASVSTNFRTAAEATLFDSYYGGAVSAQANGALKPEYSVSESVGYRYAGPLVTGTVSLFNFNFSNRQISTLVGGNLINESINAGGQSTYGVDAEAGTRPWRHISPYVSAEWLHSIDTSDLQYGDAILPTAGKTSVHSPDFQAAVGLNYDDGAFFGAFDVKYVDAQYSTFMNDESIPAYTTANLSLGYRFGEIDGHYRPQLKLNLINLTGANYLSTVASPTANARMAVARDGSVVDGTAPTYYLTGGFSAMVTASTSF